MEYLPIDILEFINSNASYTPREHTIYRDIRMNTNYRLLTFWDTSFIENMGNLFARYRYSPDLLWNTSNVTKMFYMFERSIFNGYINCWNTKNVITMNYMFSKSEFNNPINSWDVSNVEYMSGMFSNSIFNRTISKWNVNKVRDSQYMFNNARFNKNISSWNLSNVVAVHYMLNNSNIDKISFKIKNGVNQKNIFGGKIYGRFIK